MRPCTSGRTNLAVAAVECLASCKRPCTAAIASPGKWTYVVGLLDPRRTSTTC